MSSFRYTVALALFALAALPLPATAAPPIEAVAAAVDAFFEESLAELRIPGAVFVLVRDGEAALSRGYGYAHLESERPVDPEHTLFRIGSVTKLLTATGVMQFVERGLLDLDADVNEFLEDFRIPETFPEPITLRHLLTHTAGFDDKFFDVAKRDGADLEPTGAYLARALPRRVEPPGTVMNYSNFAITLAAHLMEAVSGRDFIDLMEENLLGPLGMTREGFRQPLPPELAESLAMSYHPTRRGQRPADLGEAASQIYAAGAYAGSGGALARFMLAHLQGGEHDGARILQPGTVAYMHQRHFVHDPGLTRGRALGFSERFYNDRRILWHTGRVNAFASQLVLVPEENLGFFASFNADAGDATRNALFALIANLYFPREEPVTHRSAPIGPDLLARFAGDYRQSRHVRDGIEKMAMFGQEFRFRVDGDGLVMRRFGQSEADHERWMHIGDGVFQAEADPEPRRLAFRLDDAGRVTHAFIERDYFLSMGAFERLGWHENSTRQLAFGLGVLVAIFAAPAWRGWRARRRPAPVVEIAAPRHIWAPRLLWVSVAAFLAGFAWFALATDVEEIVFGAPPRLYVILSMPMLSVLACAGCFEGALRARNGRAYLGFMALAGLGYLALLNYWNLLGYPGLNLNTAWRALAG